MSSHVSSLVIDALAAGHLAGDERAAALAHIDGCARCGADLEVARASCATFTREVLPRTIGKLRAPAPWWRTFGPTVLVPMLAAAAMLIWFVRRPDAVEPPVPEVDVHDVRIKGRVTFQVFARRGDHVLAVRDGTQLAAGDQIRFVAGARGLGFLLIASVDGAGTTTVYYPYGGARSGPVGSTPGELSGSVVLDAAPGPERVFALFSTEPLEAADVTRQLAAIGARGGAAIRATRTLDVPSKEQASIVFEKGTP